MKTICTSYTKTDKGLVLRNNWIDVILDEDHLKDYLSIFGIEVPKKKLKISDILEGEMDLENVVIHIRILS